MARLAERLVRELGRCARRQWPAALHRSAVIGRRGGDRRRTRLCARRRTGFAHRAHHGRGKRRPVGAGTAEARFGRLGHPEAVAVDEAGDRARSAPRPASCLKRGKTSFFLHMGMLRDAAARNSRTFSSHSERRAHLVELVDEGLDVAVLLSRWSASDRFHSASRKRGIDDHLLLVGMLVERVGQLRQQHLALEGLGTRRLRASCRRWRAPCRARRQGSRPSRRASRFHALHEALRP